MGLPLALMVLAVYWQVGEHSFISYDDPLYMNAQVLRGLTADGVSWAFTTFHASNWHPLTWLSHMLDVELFGADAGWHHRVNLLFHLANTLLLYGVLRRMTGAVWRSGIVAALFAVHPLHVESVAWIAERKDLLSTFFFLLAMWAYRRYAVRGGRLPYIATTAFFLLGLMSKPMVVTLPFVFLLLDYWPLGRIAEVRVQGEQALPGIRRVPFRGLIVEKVPWLLMSAASCIATYMAQGAEAKINPENTARLSIRLGNAALSYMRYLGKFFWPERLAIFYPHPADLATGLSWRQVALSAVALAAISFVVWRYRRNRPYLIVGWCCFLGMLVPAIGVVQVGWQAMADRYTYLPLIGLFIMIVWGIGELVSLRPPRRYALGALSAILLAALTVAAHRQTGNWRNSMSIFQHALEVLPDNFLAHNNIGEALVGESRYDEAISHYRKAIELRPGYAVAHYNLGTVLLKTGKPDEAIRHFLAALRYDPDYAFAMDNLGYVLMHQGKAVDAIPYFQRSLKIDWNNPTAHLNLGESLLSLGRTTEAFNHYKQALLLNPGIPEAYYGIGRILEQQGRIGEAIGYYQEAIRHRPGFEAAQNRLDALLNGKRR